MAQKTAANTAMPSTQEQALVLDARNVGLDSLRGVFALMVFFSHIELLKFYFGMEHNMGNDAVFQLGRIGVTGFFVLSGFLITIHLLRVRDSAGETGKKIKTFYTKRILRIWPLYYALILLSLYVFPHISALHYKMPPETTDARLHLDQLQYYYLFLLPQIPLAKSTILPFAEPSWSIGVEEIFYLVIPVVIFITKRYLQVILIGISLFLIIGRYVLFTTTPNAFFDYTTCIFIISRYDCIAIGCLAGLYFYQNKKFIRRINGFVFGAAVALLFIGCLAVSRFDYQYAHFALLFAVIILYVAMNSKNILNNKVLHFYGKISFSLYMTHEIVIVFFINKVDFSEYHPAVLYICSFVTATLFSLLAYKVIEEPFLKLKARLYP